MGCTEKTLLIVVLLLIVVFLYFGGKKEMFSTLDYQNEINKQLNQFNANKILDSSYNYNPVIPQCPETSLEIKSWDPNTKICKLNGLTMERVCPEGMSREGDYCYLECDEGYIRGNGLCWKQ